MSTTKTIELGPSKNVGTKSHPKLEYLEPKLTVTIGVLSAKDSFIADEYIGASLSEVLAYKVYAICSIKSINGTQVHPLANQIEFEATRDRFELHHLGPLVTEFNRLASETAHEHSDLLTAADSPAA